MAACCSAAQAKGTKIGSANKRDEPRLNTKIRALYDFFFENKGKPVEYTTFVRGKIQNYQAIEYLRSSYGLDIRRLANKRWILAGEWVGKGYIDYTIEEKAND